jgi:hypothetical protein
MSSILGYTRGTETAFKFTISDRKLWEEVIAHFPSTRHGPHIERRFEQPFYCCVRIEVEVNLWPTVNRPVCFNVELPSGVHDQILFLSDDYEFLDVGHPLSVVRMWLYFACATTYGPLGSKSCRTHDHILLPHLRLPQLGGPGPRIYIPHEQGSPVIPPGTGFPFVASYVSQGYGEGILTRLHTGLCAYSSQSQSQTHITTDD